MYNKSLRLIVKKECFDVGNYQPFLQGPLPVANYTRIIIPGRFWTRPPSTKSTRMASSATPLHDSLIELAIPDAHAHAIKWYLKQTVPPSWLYTISGLDWWTGLVDWTTGLIDFHLKRTFRGSIMTCNGGK